MTSGYPFIVKHGRNEFVTSPQIQVSFGEKRRVKRVIGGLFNEVERTGWDRSKLSVRAIGKGSHEDGTRKPPLTEIGTSTSTIFGVTVDNNTADLATAVRRLSEGDLFEIERLEEQIEAVQEQLRDLRTQRRQAVQAAWKRGKKIMVHEVRPEGDEEYRRIDG